MFVQTKDLVYKLDGLDFELEKENFCYITAQTEIHDYVIIVNNVIMTSEYRK